jgi:hypothetical protein
MRKKNTYFATNLPHYQPMYGTIVSADAEIEQRTVAVFAKNLRSRIPSPLSVMSYLTSYQMDIMAVL